MTVKPKSLAARTHETLKTFCVFKIEFAPSAFSFFKLGDTGLVPLHGHGTQSVSQRREMKGSER